MNPHNPYVPNKLRIWQKNVGKSKNNTNYILNQANPQNMSLFLYKNHGSTT